jgi:hypothetical protein
MQAFELGTPSSIDCLAYLMLISHQSVELFSWCAVLASQVVRWVPVLVHIMYRVCKNGKLLASSVRWERCILVGQSGVARMLSAMCISVLFSIPVVNLSVNG